MISIIIIIVLYVGIYVLTVPVLASAYSSVSCLTLVVMEAGLPHNDKVNFHSHHLIGLNTHPLSEVRTICSGFFQRAVVSEIAIVSLCSKVFARSSGRGGELLSRLQVCNYDRRAKKFNQHSAIDAQHLTPSRK